MAKKVARPARISVKKKLPLRSRGFFGQFDLASPRTVE
jgi:hypothetical protein